MGIFNNAEVFSFGVRFCEIDKCNGSLLLSERTFLNNLINPKYEEKCLDACSTCDLKVRKVGKVHLCSGMIDESGLSASIKSSIDLDQSPLIEMKSMKARCLQFVKKNI